MDYSYKLDWSGTTYDHESINASVLADAIFGFVEEEWDYIVLDVSPAIEKSIYLQTGSPYYEENSCYPIEIRFVYEDESFQHFKCTVPTAQEVYNIFIAYWATAKLPDTNNWEDITDQLK